MQTPREALLVSIFRAATPASGLVSIIRIDLLDVSDVAAAAIVTAKDLSTAGTFLHLAVWFRMFFLYMSQTMS